MHKGSFITEYIECKECWNNLRRLLLGRSSNKLVIGNLITPTPAGMDERYAPIITGQVAGNRANEELAFFHLELRKEIESTICHELHIAVMSQNNEGKQILLYKPKEST